MNPHLKWILPLVGAIAIGGVWYLFNSPEPTPVIATATPHTESAPAIQHPIPTDGIQKELPPLDESDASVKASLESLFGAIGVTEYLVPEQIIRHIVVTVDNLPRSRVAMQLRPIKAVHGSIQVGNANGQIVLADSNGSRYTPLVKLLQSANMDAIAGWYRDVYPLFQTAYENLGYPQGYFNDRLVAVIDHLLATPEPTAPLLLVQPKVFYEFSDPALESLSAGQKTLLRMGAENRQTVKQKLRELRERISRKS